MNSSPRHRGPVQTLVERAEFEIDIRLHSLLIEALQLRGRWTSPEIAGYLRLAYTAGYQDGLQEEPQGRLFLELGLQVPGRRK